MKIDRTSINPVEKIQATNKVASVDKKFEESKGSNKDEVKVSDKAQIYNALVQKAKDIPEIREERVRELSEQIRKGEFKVDSQAIAEKLLGDM